MPATWKTAAALTSSLALAHCSAPDAHVAPDCPPVVTFADGRTPSVTRHVTETGNDDTGTGAFDRPFRSIARALRDVTPGTAVVVHAGTYTGGIYLTGLRGTADAPIWIMGAAEETAPTLSGGGQGIYLQRPRYVVLDHLTIANTADNGINVDDGGETANEDAARFLVFSDIEVRDAGQRPSGVADCLKLAGVNDFAVLNSRFDRCGRGPQSGAVGVGGVGVHRGVVRGNSFAENGYGGVQFKGGSADVDIVGNTFRDTGARAVNMGGNTGAAFFRPPLVTSGPNAEARRIRVLSNIFIGGETAAALVGCVDCAFSQNTVVNPSTWVLRILQETVAIDNRTFEPAGRSAIDRNVFYFRRIDLKSGEDINVGPNTDSASISLTHNQWYARDDPEGSAPSLPTFRGREADTLAGVRPAFVDEAGGDFRSTSPEGLGAMPPCALAPR